jgi:hypothetical protein
MLALIPVGAVTVLIVLSLVRQEWRPRFQDWMISLAAAGVTLVLVLYYWWTLAEGKGAQTVGKWGVGLKNLLFAGYELLGFTGFGPGRYTLRQLSIDGGVSTAVKSLVHHPAAAGMVLLAFLYVWSSVRLVRWVRTDRSTDLQVVLCAVLVISWGVAALYMLSVAASFPFWGRHLAPLLAFVTFVVAVASAAPPGGRRTLADNVLPVLLCVTLLSSSLLVRFHTGHARDDYRSAVAVAQAALGDGLVVWWSASPSPALYYGLTTCEYGQPTTPRCAIEVINMNAAALVNLPRPDLIIASKPDLYDENDALMNYIRSSQFKDSKSFAAFQIFTLP